VLRYSHIINTAGRQAFPANGGGPRFQGKTLSKLRVAVLMGGTSAERAISLSTGRQIMAALDPDKYVPLALDSAFLSGKQIEECRESQAASCAPSMAHDSRLTPACAVAGSHDSGNLMPLRLSEITAADRSERPDVVFIALHGRGGEDGTVQGMLDLLGIPYTGSGVLASALAMDKAMTKKLLRAEGIPVPEDITLEKTARPAADALHGRLQDSFGYPVIVKPNAEGSTIGCSIVRGPEGLDRALEEAFHHDSIVLVEQFLAGVEITAGLLGNEEPEVLPLIEIVTKDGFYDYEAKYAPGGSAHIIPARIPDIAAARARDYATRCHRALRCRGMSRVDMIVVGDRPCVLEINTIPGMTPTSLLPDAARAAGIEFPALLDRLIGYAMR
jgi:D-alanine-D-alanine ligase